MKLTFPSHSLTSSVHVDCQPDEAKGGCFYIAEKHGLLNVTARHTAGKGYW